MSDPADRSTMISARGLTKHFEDGRIRAVNGLDMEVAAGESVAICGPSGCGKTTLLNLIAGIDRPDAGVLTVGGCCLTKLSSSAEDEFRRSVVGLVFQLHNLLPNLTALENVQIPMIAAGRPPGQRRERAQSLLERIGLADRANACPPTLSGGERQRVAIARAMANEPRLLLADEPTGALDSKNGRLLLDLLSQLQRDTNTTLVLVTHDAQVASHADRTLQMLDGRIVESHPRP